jgi:hypothetical protein
MLGDIIMGVIGWNWVLAASIDNFPFISLRSVSLMEGFMIFNTTFNNAIL